MTPEFLIAALIVVLIPGTGVIYTVAVGLTRGRRASVAAAAGCTLGIVPAIVAAALGFSAILNAGAIWYHALKYAGAAYLFYLAWRTWRDGGPIALGDGVPAERSLATIARTGTLINVLNPKLAVFFMAFLPQFIDPAGPAPLSQLLEMSVVFMAMTFVVFVIYGACAAGISAWALRSHGFMTWMRRATAAAFAGFGARLAAPDA